MKNTIVFLLLCGAALGQTVYRYDAEYPSITTTSTTPYLVANVPPVSPVLAVCTSPANNVPCTNYATTYTFSLATCPNGSQDVPQPARTSSCQTTGDAQGNIGFWAQAGTYDYTVCIGTNCYGPYTVSLGGTGIANPLEINGTLLASGDTVNFNNTTPTAPANGLNVHFQTSHSTGTDSVSAAVVGDGNTSHFLNGQGAFTSAGGGGTPCTSAANSIQYNNAGAFGCTDITLNSPFASGAGFNNYSTPSTLSLENVQTTTASVVNPTSLFIQNEPTFTGAISNEMWGINLTASDQTTTSSPTLTSLFGIQILAQASAHTTYTNTVTNVEGLNVAADGPNGANLTNLYGIRLSRANTTINGTSVTTTNGYGEYIGEGGNSGTVTNDYDLYIDVPPSAGNSPTFTHHYGLYIADQTVSNGSNNPDPHGIYVAGGGVQVATHTFTNLPSCTSTLEGRMEAVSDSTTNTWGATISGSGGDHVLAYCDGSNWTVAAK